MLGADHPHGDASVYDAMVRLAQDFSLRYPLVDGQGNFGLVDGDPRLLTVTPRPASAGWPSRCCTDIDKDTINWDPNFDEREGAERPAQPLPEPAGQRHSGIAVGMATNIPPHNLSEVIDGCVAYIDDPDIDLPGLMEISRARTSPPPASSWAAAASAPPTPPAAARSPCGAAPPSRRRKNGRTQIIITEIPYMVNKARLIENMADLVKDKRIEGITDLNDETNRKGMRIVVDVRKDANAQVILNQLYQYTQLQDTVGVIMLAIDHKVPKVLTLKQMIQKYVEFQDEVVRRRTQYDLKKARSAPTSWRA